MALGTVAFTACSNGEETIVTMVTEGTSSEFLLVGDYQDFTITVNWGDGTIKRYSSETYIANHKLENYESDQIVKPKHTYTDGKNSHTIKVCGSNIMKQTIYGFSCMDMQLTSLNINGSPSFMGIPVTSENEWSSLTHVDCRYNLLTSIRISGCPSLTVLNCGSNLLTSLDISGHTALTYLSCRNNQLTSLDVSKNRDLTTLNCEKNQLTSLDVSKNTALTELNCYNNQFSLVRMNRLYGALPNVGYNENGRPKGRLRCDKLGDWSIAEKKGWKVTFPDSK